MAHTRFYGQYKVPNVETMLSFSTGQPSQSMLPLKDFNEALTNLAQRKNVNILQYGNVQGYPQFRDDLSTYLNAQYAFAQYGIKSRVQSENLMLVNGVTGGLSLLLSTHKFDHVIVEDPTYFLALSILKDFNYSEHQIHSVPMEKDGVNLSKLQEIILNIKCPSDEDFIVDYTPKILFYTIPVFHNPTGYTLSHEKRFELMEISKANPELTILADEVYQLLSFDSKHKPPPPLHHYNTHHGKILSVSSFSKMISMPALRIGWIETCPENMKILTDCGQLDSSGCPAQISAAIIHELMLHEGEDKLASNIQNARTFLSKNCDIIYDTLYNGLDKLAVKYEMEKPIGGYFLWLSLPTLNLDNLLEISIKNRVKFHIGNKFIRDAQGKKDCTYIRLSLSYYLPDDMKIGCERLLQSIKETRDNLLKKTSIINGCTGRLGSLIVKELKELNENYIGFNSNSTIEDKHSALEYRNKISAIIDVSTPESCVQMAELCNTYEVPLIIGTTGFNDEQLTYLKSLTNIPIYYISNFSYGIPYLLRTIQSLTNLKKDGSWKIKVADIHHCYKKDAPSGTAKTLAIAIQKATGLDVTITSERTGEVVGTHIITLENEMEKITLTHQALDRRIFAQGAIRYISQIKRETRKGFIEF